MVRSGRRPDRETPCSRSPSWPWPRALRRSTWPSACPRAPTVPRAGQDEPGAPPRVMRQRDGGGAPGGPHAAPRPDLGPALGRVSRHLIHAVLASEDQKFFGHEGVDWEAIQESVDEDRKKRPLRARGQHDHPAARQEPVLHHRTRASPASCASSWWRAGWSRTCRKRADPRAVPERDRVGRRRSTAARPRRGATTASPPPTSTSDEAAGLAAMIPNPRRINPRVDPRPLRAGPAARALADGACGIGRRPGRPAWARSRSRPPEIERKKKRTLEAAPPPEPEPAEEPAPEPSRNGRTRPRPDGRRRRHPRRARTTGETGYDTRRRSRTAAARTRCPKCGTCAPRGHSRVGPAPHRAATS